MMFVMLTICITVSLLLASGLSMFIMFKLMTNQKFMTWYMNWFVKYANDLEDIALDLEFGKDES